MNEIIFQILKLLIMILAALIGAYAIPWMRTVTENEKYERICAEVTKYVLAAQQMYKENTGEERLRLVTVQLRAYLSEHRIEMTDEQMRDLIESAVKQMKIAES